MSHIKNKYYLNFSGLLIFIILFISCTKDDVFEYHSPFEKNIITDIHYGYDKKNTMDIFLPADRKPETSAIIFIHGGAWINGDKSDCEDLASDFADSGYVAATINYRYADYLKKIDVYDLLDDINNAIIFLQSKKLEFGYNFHNITLYGISAGGHLALLYAYKNTNITNVISMAGPTDLNSLVYENITNFKLIRNLIGSRNKVKLYNASPVNFPCTVNTYLFHGMMDDIVPYKQSVELFNSIKGYNQNDKLVLFNNCGHGFSSAFFTKSKALTIKLMKSTSSSKVNTSNDV